MREDYGIIALIDLHHQIIDQGGGYWIKIEAWRVSVTKDVPHGIRYSLTLHEPYGIQEKKPSRNPSRRWPN